MGQEAICRVRIGGQAVEARCLLETNEIIVRGDLRLKIPLKSISNLAEEGDELRVEYPDGVAYFELGARVAAKWASIIRNPKGLLDKLGVKEGSSVGVLGVTDIDFLNQLQGLGISFATSLTPENDFLFYEADEVDDLGRLEELKESIKSNGAIWVVSPKGKGARIKDIDVMAAARRAGLVDTKVASFSDTHTSLKLVIPKAKR